MLLINEKLFLFMPVVPLKPEARCLQSDFYCWWHFICRVYMCFGGYTHWNPKLLLWKEI